MSNVNQIVLNLIKSVCSSNVHEITSKLGIKVHYEALPQTIKGLLLHKAPNKIIVINKDMPPDVQEFTIAHQLGHILMHGIEHAMSHIPDHIYNKIEKEADTFAQYLIEYKGLENEH